MNAWMERAILEALLVNKCQYKHVMGIADIFEALTAADRPYKKGKTLTESLHILGKFRLNGHLDPDLFDVFVREKVYLDYARQFLDQEQIDDVIESKIPGYAP